MATSNAVWGIDIGQCALKAMRCTLDADGNMVADAFDFIEYPKILSQPEADREQLIADALQQFLSRNEVKGDKVAISVAGQNGLARFFKPPPVDSKKIPDIVKYEAKQQIPFALEDVIWDFQRMGGGAEVDGVALEAEIGLFAMKRDQVFRLLEPYEEAGFELDVIQLAPLSIYNFVSHCLITDGPAPEDYNPEDPPESIVVISIGTDTTDIVVTNGFRVWQRNIPLGGNHFTKQLTKELKLTFAKAEHLKRNARQAEGAKAIFQAMRPAFNDLLTEVQRSMNFFHNNDKAAKISGMVMLGNAVKLPGLQSYLSKNLGYEIMDLNESTWKTRISGPAVLSSPAFKDNILAFGVCYGLCLQALGQSHLSTNLLPREIITQRLVREKKPWAVAAVSAIMLAFAFNLFFVVNNWHMVH
ncbi:MAG: type IV pilus assembly protein PilM, partial [Pirellulaceae bacterium]